MYSLAAIIPHQRSETPQKHMVRLPSMRERAEYAYCMMMERAEIMGGRDQEGALPMGNVTLGSRLVNRYSPLSIVGATLNYELSLKVIGVRCSPRYWLKQLITGFQRSFDGYLS